MLLSPGKCKIKSFQPTSVTMFTSPRREVLLCVYPAQTVSHTFLSSPDSQIVVGLPCREPETPCRKAWEKTLRASDGRVGVKPFRTGQDTLRLPQLATKDTLPSTQPQLSPSFSPKPSVMGTLTSQLPKVEAFFLPSLAGVDGGTDACYELMLLITCQVAQTLRRAERPLLRL